MKNLFRITNYEGNIRYTISSTMGKALEQYMNAYDEDPAEIKNVGTEVDRKGYFE